MSTLPRNLAVAVEATPDRRFRWLILEARAGTPQWYPISRASTSCREWMDAFNRGVDQLLKHTRDGRFGPQRSSVAADGDITDEDPG